MTDIPPEDAPDSPPARLGSPEFLAAQQGIIAAPPAGSQYLGDPQVVDSLVRGMVIGMAQGRERMHTDDPAIAHQTFLDLMERQRADLMRILTGQDAEFATVPGWNVSEPTIGSIHVYLAARGYEEDDAAESLEALLMSYQLMFLRAITDFEDDAIDQEKLEFLLTVNTEDLVGELIGVPNEAD